VVVLDAAGILPVSCLDSRLLAVKALVYLPAGPVTRTSRLLR
jgi:hypothetical protein